MSGRATFAVLAAALAGGAVLADAMLWHRTPALLAAPALVAAVMVAAALSEAFSGAAATAPPQAAPPVDLGGIGRPWPVLAALLLVALSPRLGLPVFGLVLARSLGATLATTLALGAVALVLSEVVLVHLLGAVLPLLPWGPGG